MFCCHLLSLTANKAWGLELSRQPKVILCDVRACWCSMERCRMELCQGSSSVQEWFFATMVVKDSGCIKGQRLHSPSWRTMSNLLERNCLPVNRVSDSLVEALKSEESQLVAWGWLFTEALRNTGMVHDVWTMYTETQWFGKHQHSSGSKMELWASQPWTSETFQYWWSSSSWLRGTCPGGSLPAKPSTAPFTVKLGKTLPAWLTPICCLWPRLLYHLSYKTQREREMSGPTNSSSSAGLWEKNNRTQSY